MAHAEIWFPHDQFSVKWATISPWVMWKSDFHMGHVEIWFLVISAIGDFTNFLKMYGNLSMAIAYTNSYRNSYFRAKGLAQNMHMLAHPNNFDRLFTIFKCSWLLLLILDFFFRRPSFKYYSPWMSLIGTFLCVAVMFLMDWATALITFAIVSVLYMYISYR